jgi:ribosomal protein L16 Arg81 hydroxylase
LQWNESGRLGELIGSSDIVRFIEEYYGVKHCHFVGAEGRFADVLCWRDVNQILMRNGLEYPRIRLTKKSEFIPLENYSDLLPGGDGYRILRPGLIVDKLREGASLAIDAIDELHGPVTNLTLELEKFFREPVEATAYASWKPVPGILPHWDPVSVLVLQVAGRKRWRLYGTSRSAPLRRDFDPNDQCPDGTPDDVTLTNGDVLYVPRGCWHEAVALDEPSLHLTLTISPRTGIDLLHWLTDILREEEVFRRDLPRFVADEVKREYASTLFDALAKNWDAEIIDRFYRDHDAKSYAKPLISLPHMITDDELDLDADTVIRMATSRVVVDKGESVFRLHADLRIWTFKNAALPLVELLSDGRAHTLAEVLERTRLSRPAALGLLAPLCREGLVQLIA